MQGFSPFRTAYEIVIADENKHRHGKALKFLVRTSNGSLLPIENCRLYPQAQRFKIKLLTNIIGKVNGKQVAHDLRYSRSSLDMFGTDCQARSTAGPSNWVTIGKALNAVCGRRHEVTARHSR